MMPMHGQVFDDPSSKWFTLQDRVCFSVEFNPISLSPSHSLSLSLSLSLLLTHNTHKFPHSPALPQTFRALFVCLINGPNLPLSIAFRFHGL